MPTHGLLDIAVSMGDGAREYVGRCRCGWDSPPCANSVHASALVEDHGARSRLRSKRGNEAPDPVSDRP